MSEETMHNRPGAQSAPAALAVGHGPQEPWPASAAGHPGERRDPPRRLWLAAALLVVLLLAPPLATATGTPYTISLLTRVVIYALAAVSLDLVLGYGALISFGHAMFFAVGGYVVAVIAFHTASGDSILGWAGSNAAWVVWPIALAVCALLGWLVGLLALRTSGVEFIMITLAFGQMVYFILVSLEIYGGDDGLLIKARNTLPLVDLSQPTQMYYVCVAALALWTAFLMRLVDSRFGMVLRALRQSERRAVNLGIAPRPHRLSAFVLSAVGTGLAGVLWANYAEFVTPDMASWAKSGEFMAMVILGGVGTLLGPVLGAGVFIALEQGLAAWTEHWMLIMGPVLVLVVLAGRNGLLGGWLGGRHE